MNVINMAQLKLSKVKLNYFFFGKWGILEAFLGKKSGSVAWGSSRVPATTKKGKKALQGPGSPWPLNFELGP